MKERRGSKSRSGNKRREVCECVCVRERDRNVGCVFRELVKDKMQEMQPQEQGEKTHPGSRVTNRRERERAVREQGRVWSSRLSVSTWGPPFAQ